MSCSLWLWLNWAVPVLQWIACLENLFWRYNSSDVQHFISDSFRVYQMPHRLYVCDLQAEVAAKLRDKETNCWRASVEQRALRSWLRTTTTYLDESSVRPRLHDCDRESEWDVNCWSFTMLIVTAFTWRYLRRSAVDLYCWQRIGLWQNENAGLQASVWL